MALIEMCDVSFRYPGRGKCAIDDISLYIDEGEFVLVCGPSGCGKTTLIKQLLPIITPYGERRGVINYRDIELSSYDDAALVGAIGYVGANPEDRMITDKVWHELAFGLESMGCKRELMERRIAEISEFFGMQTWLNRSVDTLSGGEMQMVHLASVCVMEPEVLLLDEPIARLDPMSSKRLLSMISRLNSELGTTIVMAEHHLEDVFAMADKVVMLSDSRVDAVGSPAEVAASTHSLLNLPTPARIAREVVSDYEDIPLTVAEGQRWLAQILPDNGVNADARRSTEAECVDYSNRQEVLCIRDIAFAYEDGTEVLECCSLSLYEGEIFALLGGNGVGKSTLLGVLSQALKQSYGTIKLWGKSVRGIDDAPLGYKGLVYMPQTPLAMFTEITVIEELEEVLTDLDITIDERRSAAASMIDKLHLEGLEKSHPYDLSSGQQQLLSLGKLLLLEPRLILMDEPTKGLDADRKREFGDMIASLSALGTTIMIVSHDIEFCAEYADRVALMHDGRIVAPSGTREFFIGNRFFTTATNRMARRYDDSVYLPEEVVALCKKEP